MNDPSVKAAPFSQFETVAPRLRVVLLGASNLSIMFPTVVETARAMFARPLELVVAKGFGRSYGQDSKFFGKKFSGILESGLWDAVDRAEPLSTVALVTDVGNDLAYEVPVQTIASWVQTALDRLAAHDARIVLNNVPLASLRGVGAARYHVFRELYFPSCRLSRAEMLRRAEGLSEALEKIAAARKNPIFYGESHWYGLDPIHPRPAAGGEIWRRMFGALAASGEAAPMVRPRPASSWRLRRLKAHQWVHFGLSRRAQQPCGVLADGTTIAIY